MRESNPSPGTPQAKLTKEKKKEKKFHSFATVHIGTQCNTVGAAHNAIYFVYYSLIASKERNCEFFLTKNNNLTSEFWTFSCRSKYGRERVSHREQQILISLGTTYSLLLLINPICSPLQTFIELKQWKYLSQQTVRIWEGSTDWAKYIYINIADFHQNGFKAILKKGVCKLKRLFKQDFYKCIDFFLACWLYGHVCKHVWMFKCVAIQTVFMLLSHNSI